MNSNELLAKARERAKRITDLETTISTIEGLMPEVDMGHITINDVGIYEFLDEADADEIKHFILDELRHVSKQSISELEQMLGIKSVPDTVQDPVEEKLADILKAEAARIESPEDKSLGKYPPSKRDNRKKYPENMTVEDVTRMYLVEGKSRKEIQEHYGIKASTLNNFLYLHKIRKPEKKDKPVEKTEKQPDEKESP